MQLTVLNKENALEIFTGERLDSYLQEIVDSLKNFTADVETVEGRKQFASLGYTIARHKTQHRWRFVSHALLYPFRIVRAYF